MNDDRVLHYRPNHFMLVPTMACNASCKYCFAQKCGELMSDETFRSAVSFIERIADKDKPIHITFHGGEPTLAGAYFYAKALPFLRDKFKDVRLSIQSNLWAVNEEMAELFKKYNVSVGTSLDGYPEMCDAQRGCDYYKKTTAGAKLLQSHGIGIGRICTFSATHADQAKRVFEESRHPYAVHGAVPSYGAADSGLSVSCDQMKTIFLDSYEAYKADPAHCRISTIDSIARGCFEGRGCVCTYFDCLGVFAAIAPNGSVYSCQRLCGIREYCLGNVNDGLTEEDVLQSAAYKTLRACEDGMREACGDCVHFQYCSGGCLYNTLTAQQKKDPYCEAYKAVFDRITLDMALEMASVLRKEDKETPVLCMAGDKPHPYNVRLARERSKKPVQP